MNLLRGQVDLLLGQNRNLKLFSISHSLTLASSSGRVTVHLVDWVESSSPVVIEYDWMACQKQNKSWQR